jgi:hypothetical protein
VTDQFIKAYHKVFLSDDYLGLSHIAKNLLMAVAIQYNGSNNGDLSITPKLMAKHGLGSAATLDKAKKELLAVNLIGLTRQGGLPNKCSLYEITWEKRNPCNGKLDVQPTTQPTRTRWEQTVLNGEREAQIKTSETVVSFRSKQREQGR